jgi:hypothetical protein
MRLARSVSVAVLAAVLAAAAVIAIEVWRSLRTVSDTGDGGGIGLIMIDVSVAPPLLTGAVVGVAAFAWHRRRRRESAAGK